jgi:ActR/RegA family two-component response regulator
MGNKRILISERDTPYRERLRRQLSGRGWSVALAATVAEARARLDPPLHRILLELAPGDGAGETMLRQVLADDVPTRVILCKRASDPIRLARAARLGPEAFFGKPIDLEKVVRACESAEIGVY